MAEIERERLSLYITPEAATALRELALKRGYVITSGRGAGRGSVSAFLEALVEGKVQVTGKQVAGRKRDAGTLGALFASGDASLCARMADGELVPLGPIPEPATVT